MSIHEDQKLEVEWNLARSQRWEPALRALPACEKSSCANVLEVASGNRKCHYSPESPQPRGLMRSSVSHSQCGLTPDSLWLTRSSQPKRFSPVPGTRMRPETEAALPNQQRRRHRQRGQQRLLSRLKRRRSPQPCRHRQPTSLRQLVLRAKGAKLKSPRRRPSRVRRLIFSQRLVQAMQGAVLLPRSRLLQSQRRRLIFWRQHAPARRGAGGANLQGRQRRRHCLRCRLP